jgi:hypothetical protein
MEVLYLLSYGSPTYKGSERLDHFPDLKHKIYCKVVAQKSQVVTEKSLKKYFVSQFPSVGAV